MWRVPQGSATIYVEVQTEGEEHVNKYYFLCSVFVKFTPFLLFHSYSDLKKKKNVTRAMKTKQVEKRTSNYRDFSLLYTEKKFTFPGNQE